MTVSTNPDWAQTVGELCDSAARELGAIGMADSVEASEGVEMTKRLNGMLAKWSVEMNQWRDDSATLTILGGTGAATLPSEVQNIRSVRHIISDTNHRTLTPWNRDEWFRLPNRAQSGDYPSAYYVKQGVAGDELYIWPVPSSDISLGLDYARTFYFAEGPEQSLDLPKEWYEAALYGLASRCANIFGATRTDPGAVQRVDNQSRITYQALLDADRPDSYYFEYDSPVEAR